MNIWNTHKKIIIKCNYKINGGIDNNKKKENKFSTLCAVFLELKLKLRRHW